MADIKISEMTSASVIEESDNVEISQEVSSGVFATFKASILAIANKIASGINFTSALHTTNKTITGAINEIAQGGGGGAGHTILDDSGTALSQEDNLQFVGVYSEDDSVNDTTKVNIVREMTQAQYDLLSADEKKGIIRITDKDYVCKASDVVYDTVNEISVEDELNAKVDWKSNGILGAKNLNSYPYNQTNRTEYTVVWTDNGDGTVTANGKATGGSTSFNCHVRQVGSLNPLILKNGKYRITGCPSGGSDSSYRIQLYYTKNGTATLIGYEYGDGFEFTLNGDDNNADSVQLQVQLQVINGYTADDLTFNPMIRLATDTDSTYQPYAQTNKELTDNKMDWVSNGILGAKNLLKYPYYEMNKTHNGVTYSTDAEGVITAENTATSLANLYLTGTNYYYAMPLPKGKYKVSMPNSKGVTLRIGTTNSSGTVTNIGVIDGTNEFVFTVSDTSLRYNFIVQTLSGTALGAGIELKPILQIAEDNDSNWQPYAMTNRELTNVVNNVPLTAGTYTLQAVRNADNTITYSWV